MRHLIIPLVLVAVAVSPVFAGSCTLGPDTFALQVISATPLMRTADGAAVTGTVSLSPAETLKPGLTATFYVDEQVKLVSDLARPEVTLDTTQLPDGLHQVRLEASDGTRLALSTGTIPLHVLNDAALNLLGQAGSGPVPFNKVMRKVIFREAVYFNGREADLEKHAFFSGNRIFITLTDLLRHVGGSIIWGPSKSYVMVERNGVKIRFIPGTATVFVNGARQSLGRATTRIESRLFVPIRPVLRLLDQNIATNYNRIQGRALVSTK